MTEEKKPASNIFLPNIVSDTGKLPEIKKPVYRKIPTSQPIIIMAESMGTRPEGLQTFIERKNLLSHSSEYSLVIGEKGDPHIIFKSPNNTIDVGLPGVNGCNEPTQKLFFFLLTETYNNCISEGEVYNDTFTFSLNSLIECKAYDTLQSAKKALKQASKPLRNLSVEWTIYKENGIESFDDNNLFTSVKVAKNGECFVSINKYACWKELMEYWTILPEYIFSVSQDARSLSTYIQSQFRRNWKKYYHKNEELEVIKDGKYTKEKTDFLRLEIPNRTLQALIHLPSEITYNKEGKQTWITHAKRDIKDPIYNAVSNLEEAQKEYYHNSELQFLFTLEDDVPIKDWLNGKLIVTIWGSLAKTYIDIFKSFLQQKRIEANKAEKKSKKK